MGYIEMVTESAIPAESHATGRTVFDQIRASINLSFNNNWIDIDEYATRMSKLDREERMANGTYVTVGTEVIVGNQKGSYECYNGLRGKIIALETGVMLPVVIEFEDGSWDVFNFEDCRPV